VIYVLSLKRAEDAEAKVKALEAEIVSLKQRISDARELIMKKASNSTHSFFLCGSQPAHRTFPMCSMGTWSHDWCGIIYSSCTFFTTGMSYELAVGEALLIITTSSLISFHALVIMFYHPTIFPVVI
jgi:hypothetical protein